MDTEERARREREISELCAEVDQNIERFLKELEDDKKIVYAGQIRAMWLEAKHNRLSALTECKAKVLARLRDEDKVGKRLTRELIDSDLLICRSRINILHGSIVYHIEKWQQEHPPQDKAE